MQAVERILGTNEDILEKILTVYKRCFAEKWRYPDAEEFFRLSLNDIGCLNLVLKEDDTIVGYALVRPHNSVVQEVREHDPHMQKSDNGSYIETMEIVPEYRKGHGFLKMVARIIEEGEKRGFNKVSLHARVSNGLSVYVQILFGKMVTQVRRVEKWAYYNGEESADYIEITIDRKCPSRWWKISRVFL